MPVTKTTLAHAFSVFAPKTRGAYARLTIDIWEQEPWRDYLDFRRTDLAFTWQATVGEPGWYAGSLDAEKLNPDKLRLATRLLRRVAKAKADYHYDPLAIVSVLRRMGMTEGVYDARETRFLSLPKVMAPEYRAYMAWASGTYDFRNLGQVMARSPEEARPLLVEQVAKNLASHSYAGRTFRTDSRQKYVEWLASPTTEIIEQYGGFGNNDAPDARPAEEKIAEYAPTPAAV